MNTSHACRFHALTALMAVLTTSSPSPGQGGGAEDYARAARLAGEWRNLVLNESIDPVWLSPGMLVYREQASLETWRFMSVDATSGARADAFDHDMAARELAAALGRDVHSDKLPIDRLLGRDGAILAVVPGDSRVFRLEPDRIDEVELETVDELALRPTRARRSRDGGGETELIFVNRRADAVHIEWINQEGGRQRYATLQPGERHRQHTFAGHAWAVTTEDGRDLARYIARRIPGIAIIDEELRPAVGDGERPEARTRSNDSPDGRFAAEIENHNVWIRDLETDARWAVTESGTADNGYTNRMWWSPDSSHLLVMRVEPGEAHPVYLIESSPDDQVQPKLHTFDYQKPGDRIDHPRPALFAVESRHEIPIDDALFPQPWSIDEVQWTPDGAAFTFLYNQRGHQVLRLLAVDAATGGVRTIIDEASETFIDYSGKTYLRMLPDTNEAVWMSERSGWNHLYLIDLETGTVNNPITGGPWVVRGVDDLDVEARTIRFRAMGVYPDQDPYHVHHGRASLDGGDVTWLTEGDGTHEIAFSPDGRFYLDTWSRVDLPPVHEVRRASDGTLVCEIERADWTPLLEHGWTVPQRFVAKGRDGATDIWGVIFTPSTFDPRTQYPVLENIYAGPQGHFVPKTFNAWHGSRTLAELGFVVVHIDGMGTNWRSKAFHDVCWKNLGDSGFADRIPWIRAAAAERPWMDLSRIGIYGGSAGGQSALRGMLAHGDFYRAAVADCGCHDNRMDKIWWNEQWMGWPVGDHYAEQSNVTQAGNLTGDLLLIVGELDRNVDPASTMQVVNALIRADKDFELLIMPGAGHGASGTPYGQRRLKDFFVRQLLDVQPRWE